MTHEIPKSIVDGSDTTPVARVRDLGDEKWTSPVADVGSKANDEPTGEVHAIVAGFCLWRE